MYQTVLAHTCGTAAQEVVITSLCFSLSQTAITGLALSAESLLDTSCQYGLR